MRIHHLALVVVLVSVGGRAAAQLPGVAADRRLAAELGLAVGDTVRLGMTADSLPLAAIVAAIYEPRPDPTDISEDNRYLRMHLPDLAALLGAPDRVDRLGVALAPGVGPEAVLRALNRTAFGYDAHRSSVIASESSQTFVVVSRFQRAIGIITVAAGAVFLLCVMLLKVEERRLDAAVMRFVGVRRRTIFGALVLEAVAIALIGSGAGAALAYGVSALINRYYRWFFDTPLLFSLITPDIAFFGIALSLGIGAAAGALAAWRLVHASPLDLWRRG